MASSSVGDNSATVEVGVPCRKCHCGKWVAVRVSRSEKNPERLYANCPDNWCRYLQFVKVIQPVNDTVEEVMQLRSEVDALQQRVASLERREPIIERRDEVLQLKGEVDEMRLNIARQDGVVGLMKIVGCLMILYFIAGIIKRA